MRTSDHRVRHRLVRAAAMTLMGVVCCSSVAAMSPAGAATQSTRRTTTVADTVPEAGVDTTDVVDTTVAGPSGASTPVPTSAVVDTRAPVYSAVLGVTVQDPLEGARVTTAAAEKVGGVRFAETISNGRVEITVKVPPAEFQGTVDAVARLGTVRRRAITTDEITSQFTDLEARVSSARVSRDRLDQLLSKADGAADVVQLERALEQRQTTLEQLEGQLRVARARVALSTVTVTFVTPTQAARLTPDRGTPGFGRGLRNGWHALRTGGGWALAGLGAAVPFAVLIGVLVALGRAVRPGRRDRSAADVIPGSVPRTRGRRGKEPVATDDTVPAELGAGAGNEPH